MNRLLGHLVGGASLALVLAAPAAAVNFSAAEYQQATRALDLMRGLNLTVFGNMSGGHDVEGKTYVGGNLTGNNSTFGLGNAANGQTALNNGYATLTVGGSAAPKFNLNNGTAASNNYGAVIGGNSSGFTINDAGAIITIGGDVNENLSLATRQVNGGPAVARAADVSIRGYVNSITAQAAGSTVRVGSISGGANKIEVGQNATVTTASGNVGLVTAGSGSTIRLGGNVGQIAVGANSNTAIVGSVGQNGATVGANSTLAVGQGVAGNLTLGGFVRATISGDFAAANNQRDINFNGSSNEVRIGGQYFGNVNGLSNGNTSTVSGARVGNNNPAAGWTFNTGTVYAPPSADSAPDVPTTASFTSMTAGLKADSIKLSEVLASLHSETANTVTVNGDNDYTFNVANIAANGTRGYVSFDVGSSFLSARNIIFNANASNLPIIINVSGLGSNNWDWNGGIGDGYGSSLNQQVIWNFVGATGTINFKKIVHGSVLAPQALISNVTPIEGSVVAQSFNQGGEIHLGTFRSGGAGGFLQNGAAPTGVVPEPEIWVQMIAGFGLLGVALRQRRRFALAA